MNPKALLTPALFRAHVAFERLAAPVRSYFDVGPRARAVFAEARRAAEYQSAFSCERPLVSVCIATYNRADILCKRSLPSVLAQTYDNLDIVVVGDACTDDTEARVAALADQRVRFVNLPRRGSYPEQCELRWMVAGTAPMNHALSLAAGEFVTHLDDDDEHLPDRVAALVERIQARRADLIFHPFEYEAADGEWRLIQASDFRLRQVTTSSVLYHNWLRQVAWDPFAYRYGEPGDWNRFRRMKALGVRTERYERPLLRHYREANQQS